MSEEENRPQLTDDNQQSEDPRSEPAVANSQPSSNDQPTTEIKESLQQPPLQLPP